MNILFLTLVYIDDVNNRNIYADLMRKFRDEGHNIFILTPSERRLKQKTKVVKEPGVNLLKVKTLNIQKTTLIEKGVSTLLIESQYINAIRRSIPGIRFDLVLYSTPPITFSRVVRYIKKRDGAKSYLLLKDIFPQNAVDLGMLKKGRLPYLYFRHKERKLYKISDFMGCMSPANVSYLIKHNPAINPDTVEVNPNSIDPASQFATAEGKIAIRQRYHLPLKATVFLYGGNLGKPQGIDFLLEVLRSNKNRKEACFVIVGTGTELAKVKSWFSKNGPDNAILIEGLPKDEYDSLIQACDVGLIFLDGRFTIPNFPSRLLSYLENRMPVIAASDRNTDLGEIAEKNHFGFWCESGDITSMNKYIDRLAADPDLVGMMGKKGHEYLLENFTVSKSYQIVMEHFKQ